MALLKLSEYEREICKEVVSKRLETVKEYYTESQKNSKRKRTDPLYTAESILEGIERRFENFNSWQKAFLSGCLNEHIIDPYEDDVNKHDFDFLLEHDAERWENRFLKYDTAACLRNRYGLSRKDNKHHLVRPIQEKVIQVLNSNKVFYSLSDDKVYKIAVLNTETKKFWSIEASSEHAFDQINFSKFNKHYADSYMYSGTPQTVLQLVRKYEQNNELKWGYIRLKQLLEKMVEYNAEFKPAA